MKDKHLTSLLLFLGSSSLTVRGTGMGDGL